MRVLLLVLMLSGCAAFDAPDNGQALRDLNSPEMDAAIAAAQPGVPRR